MLGRTRLPVSLALASLWLACSVASGQPLPEPGPAPVAALPPLVPNAGTDAPSPGFVPQPLEGPPPGRGLPIPTTDPLNPASGGPIAALMATPFPRADYRLQWYPNVPVVGQPTSLGMVREDLSASAPIWSEGGDSLSLHAHVTSELFQTHAVLPNTGQAFPDQLWNVNFGASYRHVFDNGWIGGVSGSIGSASDQPFHSTRELTGSANAFLVVPSGERNAWLFSLSYSPTSQLPYPIPMVAYMWQPTDNFRANIGLPFQLWYRPIDDLTIDLSYMLLTTVHARATYRVTQPFRVYAGFDWSNESYFLADRLNEQDRFFYYEKRLTVGAQYFFGKQASLEAFGGYAFDRFYFEGKQLSDSHFNRVDVGNGLFVGAQFRVRW